jgi:hypothetical protein
MSESFTKEDREKVSRFLSKTKLCQGFGTAASPCSIIAINFALTGDIGDSRPSCMSPVIHRFIIEAQDSAGDEMRNSKEWKTLLPWAAGSLDEDEIELERLGLVRDWLWDTVLASGIMLKASALAGLRYDWEQMLKGRSEQSLNALSERVACLRDRPCDAGEEYADGCLEAAQWTLCTYAKANKIPPYRQAAAESTRDACSAVDAAAKAAWALAGCKAWSEVARLNCLETTWRSFEPAALLRRLIEHPNGLPAGWEA